MEKNQIEWTACSLLYCIARVGQKLGIEVATVDQGEKSEKIWDVLYQEDLTQVQNLYAQVLLTALKVVASKDSEQELSSISSDYFERPLSSVFNVVNKNTREKQYYPTVLLNDWLELHKLEPIYPELSPHKGDNKEVYGRAIQNLNDVLPMAMEDKSSLDKLMSILQDNFSYLPALYQGSINDVSLYDQAKLVAMLTGSMWQYIQDNSPTETPPANQLFQDKMFLMFSMDVSGIQKFIYTISSKGALKGLRARSFYLEILMEHIVDELLDRLELSRVHLLYSGGGHSYMILPNTQKVKSEIEKFEKDLNQWFIDVYGVALYIGTGYTEASANNFLDKPSGSYANLYRNTSAKISAKKMKRYTKADIEKLNQGKRDGDRECIICRRMDHLNEKSQCRVCAEITDFSSYIINAPNRWKADSYIYAIVSDTTEGVVLPFGKRLLPDEKSENLKVIRRYVKNQSAYKYGSVTRLWVGDYSSEIEFSKLADSAKGIKRIAVFRADVDNLGTTFVSGFRQADGSSYANLARSTALSGQLSLFFKYFINQVIRYPQYQILNPNNENKERKVSIVYSGGDDVFLVGAWNDVIEAAIDLRDSFQKFSQKTLTLSGGIGIYHDKFPINVMAEEVAELEDHSKGFDGKDAISLFNLDNGYKWIEFKTQVLEQKFATIKEFFDGTDEHGKNFLYNILNLFCRADDKINIARLIYLLARLEPADSSSQEKKQAYKKFADSMYRWIQNDKDRKQAITAIYLYVYLNRTQEKE